MVALNFKAEFADDVELCRKRRSIRAPRKDGRNPKAGDVLQLYTGMRQKICRKLGNAVCLRVRPVEIDHMGVKLDGKRLIAGDAPAYQGGQRCMERAAKDGLVQPNTWGEFEITTAGRAAMIAEKRTP